MTRSIRDHLDEIRRTLHRYPEPGWCEFYTTHQLFSKLQTLGVDELAVGPAGYDPADRMAVPDMSTIEQWSDRALDKGADPELLEQMAGGNTGVVATLEQGDGPSIGLRVDIDGLYIEESTNNEHLPASESFRSETGETMHACGHDVHMTWGLATLEAVKASEFDGQLTVFFQPAEEISGGGHPMAKGEYTDGLDYFLAPHVGLGHPTGEVVGGIEQPLAECQVDATITGSSSHAAAAPEVGDNAMQALGAAIQNAYSIPRHSEGLTRVNVGKATAGTASNVIADRAVVEAEVRGETNELLDAMKRRLDRAFEAAAVAHGCSVDIDVVSEVPRADSDRELEKIVADAAEKVSDVNSVLETADFGASEDATYLMKRIQDDGGYATYLIIGTDHPSGHHSPMFDVDERSLDIGTSVLTDSILAIEAEHIE